MIATVYLAAFTYFNLDDPIYVASNWIVIECRMEWEKLEYHIGNYRVPYRQKC